MAFPSRRHFSSSLDVLPFSSLLFLLPLIAPILRTPRVPIYSNVASIHRQVRFHFKIRSLHTVNATARAYKLFNPAFTINDTDLSFNSPLNKYAHNAFESSVNRAFLSSSSFSLSYSPAAFSASSPPNAQPIAPQRHVNHASNPPLYCIERFNSAKFTAGFRLASKPLVLSFLNGSFQSSCSFD